MCYTSKPMNVYSDTQPALCIGLRRVDLSRQERILISPISRFDDTICRVITYGDRLAVITRHAIHIDGQRFPNAVDAPGLLFAGEPAKPLTVSIHKGNLRICEIATEKILTTTRAERFQIIDNRLYIEVGSQLIEMCYRKLGTKTVLAAGASWPLKIKIEERAMMNGLFYCDMLGLPHLLLPFRSGICQPIAVPELRDHIIVNGCYDNGVARVMIQKDDSFIGLTLCFDDSHTRYWTQVENDLLTPEIDFVCLDHGVVINSSTTIELFDRQAQSIAPKIFAKSAIFDARLRLARHGSQALAFSGDTLYKITMQTTERNEYQHRASVSRKLRSKRIRAPLSDRRPDDIHAI